MAASLNLRPLDEAFGAEILGAEPEVLLTPGAQQAWHAALAERQLLVFRDLALRAEQQEALAASLGTPLVENPSGRTRRQQFGARWYRWTQWKFTAGSSHCFSSTSPLAMT